MLKNANAMSRTEADEKEKTYHEEKLDEQNQILAQIKARQEEENKQWVLLAGL